MSIGHQPYRVGDDGPEALLLDGLDALAPEPRDMLATAQAKYGPGPDGAFAGLLIAPTLTWGQLSGARVWLSVGAGGGVRPPVLAAAIHLSSGEIGLMAPVGWADLIGMSWAGATFVSLSWDRWSADAVPDCGGLPVKAWSGGKARSAAIRWLRDCAGRFHVTLRGDQEEVRTATFSGDAGHLRIAGSPALTALVEALAAMLHGGRDVTSG